MHTNEQSRFLVESISVVDPCLGPQSCGWAMEKAVKPFSSATVNTVHTGGRD